MEIVSYSERKLTLEMTFRTKTDVIARRKNDVSTLRYARSFDRLQLRTSGFKRSEHINEKGDGSYRGFGYLSLFSDPIDLAT